MIAVPQENGSAWANRNAAVEMRRSGGGLPMPLKMTPTWYVTFDLPRRGTLVRRRSHRSTRTFETEAEAKNFARMKFQEGLIVTAGTIIPHSPRRAIASGSISPWLAQGQEQDTADPDITTLVNLIAKKIAITTRRIRREQGIPVAEITGSAIYTRDRTDDTREIARYGIEKPQHTRLRTAERIRSAGQLLQDAQVGCRNKRHAAELS